MKLDDIVGKDKDRFVVEEEALFTGTSSNIRYEVGDKCLDGGLLTGTSSNVEMKLAM